MSRLVSILCLFVAAGCAGDPDLGAVSEAITLRVPVERIEWERAIAGCEGAPRRHTVIFPAAGEPSLGALVDLDGHVLCVDSLSLLAAEEEEEDRSDARYVPYDETLHDPTPTPLTPRIER